MAKKKNVKALGSDVCAPCEMPQSIYFDLEEDEIDLLKEMKVGDTVVMVVRGKVSSISQREETYNGKKVTTGTLRLSDPEFEVATQSVWATLADDSED